MEKLRIAVIAPPFSVIPPPGYAGTELVAWNTAKGLHSLGHEVTLMTVEGSGPADFALMQTRIDKSRPSESHYEQFRNTLGGFDAVIDNSNLKTAWRDHGAVLNAHHWCQHPAASGYRNLCGVSMWLANWLADKCMSWRRVPWVYNPVDTDLYPYTPDKEDYLLFFSKIAKYKGALEALEVAKRTGQRMIFAGQMGDAGDEIKAANLPNVEVLGEVSFEKKVELMRHATVLVFPTGAFGKADWTEVFGLVQVEAMSCGTPVVAARNGATPEIVYDYETGFLCDSVDEMVDAIAQIDTINPKDCRETVEQRFSVAAAALEYEALCAALASGKSW